MFIARIARIAPVIAISSALITTVPGCQESRQSNTSAPVDRVQGWRSDISFWLDKVREQHYVYKTKPLPKQLLDAAEDLSQNVHRFSDERALYEMQRLAAFIGDGHTYVLPLAAERVPGSMMPIRFYLFSDGMYVVDAMPGFEKWIGSRLETIGSATTAQLEQGMKETISADNSNAWKWIGPPFMNLRGAIESMTGLTGDSIPVVLRDRNGQLQRVKFATYPPPRLQGIPKLIPSRMPGTSAPPLWLRSVSKTFWTESLDDRTLYVQFNQVMNDQNRSLKEYAAEMRSRLVERKPSRVILDVRHNNGGNSYLFPPIIDALLEWENADASRKLYVLMGRNTFSAAQNFIAQLDKRTRAIFVGEPSSSSPNFVGEENNFQLPWSGATISISNRYHENIPGDKRKWIEPDIPVALSSRDYFAGRDPVLESLIK